MGLEKIPQKPSDEIRIGQSGEESWYENDLSPEQELERNIKALGEIYDQLASSLVAGRNPEEGQITENELRSWLSNHGVENVGQFPFQDSAAERLMSRLAPESKEHKALQKKLSRSKAAFEKSIRNKKDPDSELRDKILFGKHLEARLGLALAVDHLSRIGVEGQFGVYPQFDNQTHLQEVVDPNQIIRRLQWHAQRRHNGTLPEHWVMYLPQDQKELSSREDAKLVVAAIQASGGQNPRALITFWESQVQSKKEMDALQGLTKGQWNSEIRAVLEKQTTDLRHCWEYLLTVAETLEPLPCAVPRSADERQKVADDIAASGPYNDIIESEEDERLGHAHRMHKVQTRAGRLVKVQGGKTGDGETYFYGFGASHHWAVATAEELKRHEGVLYQRIPQNNAFAYELLSQELGFDMVPVTLLGTKEEVAKSGKKILVNLFAQEWIKGLERITEENQCALGELALAQDCMYILYDRDWGAGDMEDENNIGNIGVDKKGKVYLIDPDIILQEKQQGEESDIPLFVKDKGHALVESSQYGVPRPDYARRRYQSLTDEELLQIAERKRKYLPKEEHYKIEATINRLKFVRGLVNQYGYLPAIYQPDGTVWDYLAEPYMFNPNPDKEIRRIITIFEQQRRAQAAA